MSRQRDIVISRNHAGELETSVHHLIVHGAPSGGFEVGYAGSGPTDLALNILHQFLPPTKTPFAALDTRGWTADSYDKNAAYENARIVCHKGVCSKLAFELRCKFRDEFLVALRLANGQSVTLSATQIAAWIDREREEAAHV